MLEKSSAGVLPFQATPTRWMGLLATYLAMVRVPGFSDLLDAAGALPSAYRAELDRARELIRGPLV